MASVSIKYRSSMLLAQKMDVGAQKYLNLLGWQWLTNRKMLILTTSCNFLCNHGKLLYLSWYHLPHLQKQGYTAGIQIVFSSPLARQSCLFSLCYFLLLLKMGSPWCGSVGWSVDPCTERLPVWSPVRMSTGGNQSMFLLHWHFSRSLSPPLPLSKISKTYPQVKIKK